MLQWHASDMSQAHVDLGMHIIPASQASVRACLQYTYHCNGQHLIRCLQRQECLDGTPCLGFANCLNVRWLQLIRMKGVQKVLCRRLLPWQVL